MVTEGEHGLLDARRRLEEYEKLLSDKDASLSTAESEVKRLRNSLKLAVADLEASALEHEADLAKVAHNFPSSPPHMMCPEMRAQYLWDSCSTLLELNLR